MAGLSIWHILLFAVVLILLFGTAKLKNLGKDLGGAVKDFKDSVKSEDDKEQAKLDQNRTIDGTASTPQNKSSHQDKS
jgi:sec-independent protein translocase protein TatA